MSSPRPTSRRLPFLAVALVLAGCSVPSAADPAPPSTTIVPAPTPEHAPGPAEDEAPHVVIISTEVDGPAGRSGLVEIRATVVGQSRHVVFDTPLGPMGEHFVTPGDHWFRLPSTAAEGLGIPADWIHVPIDELEMAGIDLPAALAEVRAPLPDPATVEVGDLVHGSVEILAVERSGDRAAILSLDDGRTVVVRRRSLPADTTLEPPASAVDVRDLDDTGG